MSTSPAPQQPYPLVEDIEAANILHSSRAAFSHTIQSSYPPDPTHAHKRPLSEMNPLHETQTRAPYNPAGESSMTFSCTSSANTSMIADVARSILGSRHTPLATPAKRSGIIIFPNSGEVTPQVKKGRWSDAEDKLLYDAVHRYGQSNWDLITKSVPGRTEVQCRNRWVFWKRWTFRNTIQSSPDVGSNFLTFTINPKSRTLEQEPFTLEQTPAQSYPVVPYSSSEFPTSPLVLAHNKESLSAPQKLEPFIHNTLAPFAAPSDSAHRAHPLSCPPYPIQEPNTSPALISRKGLTENADVDTDTDTDTDTETETEMGTFKSPSHQQPASYPTGTSNAASSTLPRSPSGRVGIHHLLN